MKWVRSQRPAGGQVSPSWRSKDRPASPAECVSTVLICNHSDKDKCSQGGGVTTSPLWSTSGTQSQLQLGGRPLQDRRGRTGPSETPDKENLGVSRVQSLQLSGFFQTSLQIFFFFLLFWLNTNQKTNHLTDFQRNDGIPLSFFSWSFCLQHSNVLLKHSCLLIQMYLAALTAHEKFMRVF